jgi:acylphosphatase
MSSDGAVCRRFVVSGKVQGVAFRASARKQARRLGVTGYAHNLRDRTVEVLACGPVDAVTALEEWLCKGPAMAQVTHVEANDVDVSVPTDFTIGNG